MDMLQLKMSLQDGRKTKPLKIFHTGAYTIMEIMVVVVLIGIIAAFALPTYTDSLRKSHESDIESQLEILHAANFVYFAERGRTWRTSPRNSWETDLAVINTTLNIQLLSTDGTTFRYRGDNGNRFDAEGTWDGMTIRINEDPISASNPNCQVGPCPTL